MLRQTPAEFRSSGLAQAAARAADVVIDGVVWSQRRYGLGRITAAAKERLCHPNGFVPN